MKLPSRNWKRLAPPARLSQSSMMRLASGSTAIACWQSCPPRELVESWPSPPEEQGPISGQLVENALGLCWGYGACVHIRRAWEHNHAVFSSETGLLDELHGRELASVEFVRDYVQLRFDGPCLTAYTHPTVQMGDNPLHWDAPGYRDALRSCIGTVVTDAAIEPDQEIRIRFSSGAVVSISLRPDDYVCSEAATLRGNDGRLAVW